MTKMGVVTIIATTTLAVIIVHAKLVTESKLMESLATVSNLPLLPFLFRFYGSFSYF